MRRGYLGAGIFSDDLACDVRDGDRDLLSDGPSAQDAHDRMKAKYADVLADLDERGVFWLAVIQ